MKNRIISRLGQKAIFLCSHSLQLSLLPHLFLTQTVIQKRKLPIFLVYGQDHPCDTFCIILI